MEVKHGNDGNQKRKQAKECTHIGGNRPRNPRDVRNDRRPQRGKIIRHNPRRLQRVRGKVRQYLRRHKMNNQTKQILTFIDAKRRLGLPLTRREVSLWTLYGAEYEKQKSEEAE